MLDLTRGYSPYYAERAAEKDRARQVGWRDRSAQHSRFEQFVRAIRHSPGSSFEVADIGCGLGDLLPFLRDRGFTQLSYTGYDILPGMIAEATAVHRGANAEFRLIEDIREIGPSDYCFASGIFNARLGHSDEAWWDHVRQCIREMAAKSGSAAAFNLLSTYSDEEKRDSSLYYADPGRIFDWCKREVGHDVALLHDYGNWDFTIIIRTDQASAARGDPS